MVERHADIVIFGAGIAGLWAFHTFKKTGYDVLLLESNKIGGGQSIASQGIIHSGLKYAFAGKINKLAQSISAMPDLWRAALRGDGEINLTAARANAASQYLLVPSGLMGGLVNLVTKKALGKGVCEVSPHQWPEPLKTSGYKGRVIFMNEPVLDVHSVIKALAEPFKASIKAINTPDDPLAFLEKHNIKPQHIIFTGAASNAELAKKLQHDNGLETQSRPLLQGIIRNAPFEIYAHLVGTSDKPVASITSHSLKDGSLIWYVGAAVAERPKESDPQEVFSAMSKAFKKYFPALDWSNLEWAVLPIDRIEGKSAIDGWMPDTPTIHSVGNTHYCWPTKLTFAPLLAERLKEKITTPPSSTHTDWSFLQDVDYADFPWDEIEETNQWKKSV